MSSGNPSMLCHMLCKIILDMPKQSVIRRKVLEVNKGEKRNLCLLVLVQLAQALIIYEFVVFE